MITLEPRDHVVHGIFVVTQRNSLKFSSTRTIAKFTTAGLLVRAGHGKYDLLESTSAYIEHLRRVASGLTTADAKVLALTSLTELRNAQRDLIEKKSKGYVLIEDITKLARVSANIARGKLLELPRRLRKKIEDSHPSLIASHKEAVAVEDSIEAVCD